MTMRMGGSPWGQASMAIPVMGYPQPFSAPSSFHPASFQPPHYWQMNNMIMQPGPIFTSHPVPSFLFQSMGPITAGIEVRGTPRGVARDVSPMRHASPIARRHASPAKRSSDAEQQTSTRTRPQRSAPVQAFGVKPIKLDTGAPMASLL